MVWNLTDLFPLKQKTLIWQFARRDVQSRYRGSLLGLTWSFLTPLMMLAVYTFVFREVLNARWPGSNGGALEFALRAFTGLLVFNLFSELLSRAPNLVTGQPNLVKKVVFPLEILPWVAVLAGLFHAALNVLVLVAVMLFNGLTPTWTWLALPLIFVAFMPFLLGLGWLLSSLGVYLRDIGQATGMVSSVLMFMSPIFYPTQALPAMWREWMWLNPLTLIIEQIRAVTLDGHWPDWEALGLYLAISLVFASLASRWFAATRRGFSDVL